MNEIPEALVEKAAAALVPLSPRDANQSAWRNEAARTALAAVADDVRRQVVEGLLASSLCDDEMHWRLSGVVGFVRLSDLREELDRIAREAGECR